MIKNIADTGTDQHYGNRHDPRHRNVQPDSQPIAVAMPNADTETNSHVATLPIPTLQPKDNQIKLFDNFQHNLVSVGQLCDQDCTAHFSKTDLQVNNNHGTTILHGKRNPHGDRLWHVDFPEHSANAINKPTGAQLV
ncbi:hypothetical protein SEMRO_1299_G260670.1 [Seminavis robusta]|uniref:Uncharacterized protein n=1 Tax=Seminavis robusta TaxID=568900 RepID=A0A9N8EKJ0_9STRA|nr:hypothetical protein SEMRO_1299_G260670.1 [Seminavis robusta]|eukprot:Sro1299_g260670.1 n/a (137) ;mRNA; r:4333-4743